MFLTEWIISENHEIWRKREKSLRKEKKPDWFVYKTRYKTQLSFIKTEPF